MDDCKPSQSLEIDEPLEDSVGMITWMTPVVIPGWGSSKVTHNFVDINTQPAPARDGIYQVLSTATDSYPGFIKSWLHL